MAAVGIMSAHTTPFPHKSQQHHTPQSQQQQHSQHYPSYTQTPPPLHHAYATATAQQQQQQQHPPQGQGQQSGYPSQSYSPPSQPIHAQMNPQFYNPQLNSQAAMLPSSAFHVPKPLISQHPQQFQNVPQQASQVNYDGKSGQQQQQQQQQQPQHQQPPTQQQQQQQYVPQSSQYGGQAFHPQGGQHLPMMATPQQLSHQQQFSQQMVQVNGNKFMLSNLPNNPNVGYPYIYIPVDKEKAMLERSGDYEEELRKARHIKTPTQMKTLKSYFSSNQKPNKEEMKKLIKETGCTYSEICRWFRNERHKEKKMREAKAAVVQAHQQLLQQHQAQLQQMQGPNAGSNPLDVNALTGRSPASLSSNSSPISPASYNAAALASAADPTTKVEAWLNIFQTELNSEFQLRALHELSKRTNVSVDLSSFVSKGGKDKSKSAGTFTSTEQTTNDGTPLEGNANATAEVDPQLQADNVSDDLLDEDEDDDGNDSEQGESPTNPDL